MTLWRWKHNQQRILLTKVVFILINQLMVIGIYGRLCEVETGQNNIIVDIEESRGNYIGQRTNPPELPIHGDVDDEITLGLNFPDGNPLFELNGKFLQLLHPLDRDKENLSHIVFQISCTIKSTRRNRNIPIIVRVSDVNDNAPVFLNTPYETIIPESTPVGTTIFTQIKAEDIDAGVNGLVEYYPIEGAKNFSAITPENIRAADGYGTFAISFPHNGHITVVKSLDYEHIQRYYLTIVASDRARNTSERLSATTTLTINVVDADDQDPSFVYKDCLLFDGACINPEYRASVAPGTIQDILEISPEPIKAVDLDAISSPIKYSFESGTPSNYGDYFKINAQTAVVQQTRKIDSFVTAREFEIIVRAEEDSETQRFTTAKLIINVKPVDIYPPVIMATAMEGFVNENSPIGTRVVDAKGNPIKITTTDADLPGESSYSYDLTTDLFAVSDDGVLMVNDDGLDYDSPSTWKYMFQIVAREINGDAASAPLTITVLLKDVNDNPPKLPEVSPVSVTAGTERRFVTRVTATDKDSGENAKVTYSIVHVSNNGFKKFEINDRNGDIYTRDKLIAGDKFNLTIRASDIGNLFSETVVEVTVVAGPNTKPPIFNKSLYEVEISEVSDINSTVIEVQAEDPESDAVKYSIISGNDLRQFYIDEESGVVSIIRKLDREILTKYQLIVSAQDTGKLSSTATINVKVLDFNDHAPEFDESMLPFVFTVEEGKINVPVGMVQATDFDEGANAEITYSIPDDVPFAINPKTGEIKTKVKLDFESKNEYKFLVTATDGADEPKHGTTLVTVLVKDVQDELPKFAKSLVEVKVPENVPNLVVATIQIANDDAVNSVTYVLRKGPTSLFKIDSRSGQIKTIMGLDYEKSQAYDLIVGTAENRGRNAGDIVKVKVLVQDKNDVSPMFITKPKPLVIHNDLPVDTVINTMSAIDGDGTSPGNVVRYEIIGKKEALKYFQVDPNTGDIRIRDDLRKGKDMEYLLDIRAYDLGEPQLSVVATLPISIKQIPNETQKILINTENSDALGLAFSDGNYLISVPESTGINAAIKLIQVINSKSARDGIDDFDCEIVSGNEMRLFETNVENNACILKLAKSLDFELQTVHEIGLRLTSNKYLVNMQRNFATVKINVLDENDNAPEFKFPKSSKFNDRNNTYYAITNYYANPGTTVLHVKAFDRDSKVFALIKYRIFDEDSNFVTNDDLPSYFFTINEDTGEIKVRKPFQGVREKTLKFYVEARDNYGKENGVIHKRKARVVVNLIADSNRMTLVFSDSGPSEVGRYAKALEDLLHEKSGGLITGIEKFAKRRSMTENGSVVEIPDATDVWFYVIDPKSEKILERNSTEIFTRLLEPNIQSQINFAASRLIRATADGIFGPIEAENEIRKLEVTNSENSRVFHYSIVSLAAIVFLLGVCGIIYMCVYCNRHDAIKEQDSSATVNNRNTLQRDPHKIHLQNGHAVQVNLKELIVAYDGSAR